MKRILLAGLALLLIASTGRCQDVIADGGPSGTDFTSTDGSGDNPPVENSTPDSGANPSDSSSNGTGDGTVPDGSSPGGSSTDGGPTSTDGNGTSTNNGDQMTTTSGGVPNGTDDPLIYYDLIPAVRNVDGPVCPTISLSHFAVTPNQRAVGSGLDAVSGTATGNVANLLQQIMALSSSGAGQAALNSLSGEVYGTAQTVGMQIGSQSLRVISNRIVNNELFLNDGDNVLISQRGRQLMPVGDSAVVRGQSPMSGPYGWVQGYGSAGGLGSNGNAATTDYNLGGLAYGIDLARDETGLIGIAGGNTFTTLGNDLTDRGHISSYQVGLYAMKRIESLYGFGVVNYGHNRNDINRNIQIGNINSVASSSFVGHQLGAYGETGMNLDTRLIRIQPFFGLQYLYLSDSKAFENGGAGAGLNVAASNLNTLQTHLGTRLIVHSLTDRSGRRWTPYVSGRWVSELLGEQATAFASLSGAPAGASWSVTGNQSGRNFGTVGPGMTVQVTEWISAFANYDYLWGDRFDAHTGSGGLLLLF